MARFYILILLLFIAAAWLSPKESHAQSGNYEWIPAPDLWYNDVDGIRFGLRLKGQVPGTFEDGPHRLDSGVWLSTWFPETPVSYYLAFTEPIPDWSEYGSEASIRLLSSIRTGYHRHGIIFSKRWQQGFDERKYRELVFSNTFEKRFEDKYTPFPVLWSDANKAITHLSINIRDSNFIGWYSFTASAAAQVLEAMYAISSVEVGQHISFNEHWEVRLRAFGGVVSANAAPEYQFARSSLPAQEWTGSGLTRAKGTVPQPWMGSGRFQVSGGANLRGYIHQDVVSFTGLNPEIMRSVAALNLEFDYFNPAGLLFKKIPYLSDFLSFRSYLFFDAGRSLNVAGDDDTRLYADSGTGFSLSLNVPDYLGKERGFVFRYELPFWLSEAGREDSWKLRHLFAVGAVISF